VLTCAVGFGTWAGCFAIVGSRPEVGHNWGDVPTLIIVLGLLAAIAMFTLRQRRDVFPLALIAASLIALSTTALARFLDFGELGMFFLLALWLVASSTFSGRHLMRVVRAWRREAGTQ
jgi:hypothetical protein